MFEGKDYRDLDHLFPLVVYADNRMDFEEEKLLAKIHVQYIDMNYRLICEIYSKCCSTDEVAEDVLVGVQFKKKLRILLWSIL